MSIYSFHVNNAEFPHLEGFLIDVRVMNYPGFQLDPPRLELWAMRIADDLANGLTDEDDLREECVNIKVKAPDDRVLADTLRANK